jgi:RNA polymerase sigma factor (sigma-70 family)
MVGNTMTDANQLLRAYVAENSEDAFRGLVEGHVGLVYSAALRMVCGDATLARDVTQMVFTDLARNARTLPADLLLSGWLYRHTTFTASKLLRAESRRRTREKEAAEMNAQDEPEPIWEQIMPLLDGAICSLSARDRDAVVMRFFDKQDFRSLAATLELSEDAAQKRVSRALEKLRRYFQRRGVAVSTVALSGVIAAHGVSAVPATLASAVAGNALAQAGAAATPFLISLIMAKIKTIAVSAVVVAAVTTPLVLQHNSISRLRSENQRLQQQIAAQTEPAPAIPAVAAVGPTDNRELLQLRAEVARLRREQADLAKVQASNKPLRAASVQPSAPQAQEPLPSESWADRGFGSPMDTLQTAHWAIRNANVEKFRESIMITDDARRKLHDLIAKMAAKAPPEEARKILDEVAARGWDAEEGLFFPMIAQNQKHGYKSYRVLTESITQSDEQRITIELQMNTAPAETRQFRFKQFGNAWKQVIDVADLPPEVRN